MYVMPTMVLEIVMQNTRGSSVGYSYQLYIGYLCNAYTEPICLTATTRFTSQSVTCADE